MISAFLHLVNVFLSNTSLGNLPIFDGPFPSLNAKENGEKTLYRFAVAKLKRANVFIVHSISEHKTDVILLVHDMRYICNS